jgi:hypothetical protein
MYGAPLSDGATLGTPPSARQAIFGKNLARVFTSRLQARAALLGILAELRAAANVLLDVISASSALARFLMCE